VVGVIAVTERLGREAEEEETSIFFTTLFDKLLGRQNQIFDAFVVGVWPLSSGRVLRSRSGADDMQNEQIRVIEAAKVTVKKRKGVAFFVRHFPVSATIDM
jgi:hypothetical protein